MNKTRAGGWSKIGWKEGEHRIGLHRGYFVSLVNESFDQAYHLNHLNHLNLRRSPHTAGTVGFTLATVRTAEGDRPKSDAGMGTIQAYRFRKSSTPRLRPIRGIILPGCNFPYQDHLPPGQVQRKYQHQRSISPFVLLHCSRMNLNSASLRWGR